MSLAKHTTLLAVLLSMALHALGVLWLSPPASKPNRSITEPPVVVELVAPQPTQTLAPAPHPATTGVPAAKPPPAMQEAPSAPSAEDWAFAGRYTLKNSKGYRHNWGRQVRSMMGTALEGPDQGMVRFRIEIAPNGTLARLDTLWRTSAVAEQKARDAIANLPPLPPTPTGKPLVFEKTIVFSPFASDDTPLYRHDCDPDVPAFRNPFVWDGQSDRVRDDEPPPRVMSAQELEDCRKQLPPETVQSESARDQRVWDRWGTTQTGEDRLSPRGR